MEERVSWEFSAAACGKYTWGTLCIPYIPICRMPKSRGPRPLATHNPGERYWFHAHRQYFPGMFRAGPPCRGIAWKSIAGKSIARNGAVSTAGGAGYRSTLGQAETGLSRGGSLAKSPHISAEMAQRDHYPLRIYSMGIKGETEFS